MKRTDAKYVVGLDIGTSKVTAIVGEVGDEGVIEVAGYGTHASRGLKKGAVVNIESAVQSIQRAVESAERSAQCEIHSVYTGIAGDHIHSMDSDGSVAIRDKEVGREDVLRVLDVARAVSIPADQRILHVLPQEYIIDRQEGIRDPLGMSGVRLETRVHIVTGAIGTAQNIVKCVRRCGLEVEDIILQQLASSESTLLTDEKDLGVCLIDIGGGTTDIAVFVEGAIRHTTVIPIAGTQITNDIAIVLRTPPPHAEQLKIGYGSALARLTDPDEDIDVPSVGERPPRRLSRQILAEVIEPRFAELFALVKAELRRSGFENAIAAGGVVLAGGSANIEGLADLAEEILHVPVRIGVPQGIGGPPELIGDPAHATGLGLLQFGARQGVHASFYPPAEPPKGLRAFFSKVKGWFEGNF